MFTNSVLVKTNTRFMLNNVRFLTSTSNLNSQFKPPNFAENAKYFPAKKTPMLPKDTFSGKVAYITGGGTGLGKNMATVLSSLGAKVFITSRREEVLKKASEEISSQTGNQVGYFPSDVRNVEQTEQSLNECIKQMGQTPTLIINNAAGNFIAPSERLSPNAVKAIVDIVLLGTINTTLLIGKKLIQEKTPASFLSIITTYAETGSGFVLPSACSKAGVVALTKSLATEWSKYGMRFNGISPGPIYTEGAFSRLDPTGEFAEKSKERIPIGRLGDPVELSNLAAYLLSDYASWITGQIITMDGGELVNNSGEFNYLYSIDKEKWDQMEKLIRQTSKKK